MTQREAIYESLKNLGGKARLADIYSWTMKLATFKEGSDIKATIRAELLRHPESFRRSEGQEGWWELVSYQKEIAVRDAQIAELTDEIKRLKAIKTEDDFVRRMVKETKLLYKHEKEKTDVVRQILYKLGRSDEEAELDAWIEGKEYKPIMNVTGDYVLNKNVQNEVTGVANGASGIVING